MLVLAADVLLNSCPCSLNVPQQLQTVMTDPAPKPKIEDSKVAQHVKNIVLVIDYGSQYTQLITRRCDASYLADLLAQIAEVCARAHRAMYKHVTVSTSRLNTLHRSCGLYDHQLQFNFKQSAQQSPPPQSHTLPRMQHPRAGFLFGDDLGRHRPGARAAHLAQSYLPLRRPQLCA